MVSKTNPAGLANSAQPGLRWVGQRSSQPSAVDPNPKSFTAKHYERMLQIGSKKGGFFAGAVHLFTYDPQGVQPCGLAPPLSP